ncbi:hypothetical protein AB0G15_05560 [Streptosporangium sp. NPDC023825]|uniref:deoxynucleotide monophosphate kinase family protein n=1 Tax=Streptosporangium sp. NPDC023825 TaxID=3154909 RepID=UPI00344781E0
MTQVIALCGYAGVGKDTVANILAENHGFKRLAFADKVKEVLLEIDPIIQGYRETYRLSDLIEGMGWDYAKGEYPEIRRLLQHVGTDFRNLVDDQAWIRPVVKEIFYGSASKVVVSDVRFFNEARALRNISGTQLTIVRLTRPGIGPANDHISENTPIPHDLEAPLDSVSLDQMPSYVENLLRLIESTQDNRQSLWDKFIKEIDQVSGQA